MIISYFLASCKHADACRIYGVPSDPYKTAAFREVMAARATCLQTGQCQVDEPRFYNFSRLLIKVLLM